jgi:predicted dehydrogenase
MDRREFLKSSAAVVAVSRVAGASPVAPSDRVRVGFIGVGRQGRGLLGGFLKQPEVDIPVLCDVYKPSLDEALGVIAKRDPERRLPETAGDFRRVLDRSDIDAVVIASPDHWHALMSVMACQTGKDVYVEKPISVTIDEGRKMVEAARKHKRIVQVGTQQRSGVHFQKAVEVVQSGRLGKITFVRTWNYGNSTPAGIGNPPDSEPPAGLDWDLWLGPAAKRPFNANRFGIAPDRWSSFRWFWDYAGGMMTDWGVHLLDIVLWAMKSSGPESVSATGGKLALDDNRETPDTLFVTYQFPGWVCTYEHREGNARQVEAHGYGIAFHGTNATLFVDRQGYEIFPETRRVDNRPEMRAEPDAVKTSNSHGEDHARNFLACMKSRQFPICDIEIGHRSTATCHLGNIAVRTGERFRWDSAREAILDSKAAARLLAREYRSPWKLRV